MGKVFDVVSCGGRISTHREQREAFDVAKAWSMKRREGVSVHRRSPAGKTCVGTYVQGKWHTAPAGTEWREFPR